MPDERAPQPLDPREEQTWRALVRLMVVMPRVIDEDLSRRAGISLTRYVVLMRLSEAPNRGLRMTELAEAASMSPSRMTRIVASMVDEGLVTREPVPGDARAGLARLTCEGLERLSTAWPAHLAGVRALVLDHIDPDDLPAFSRVLERLLVAVEDAAGGRRDPGCLPDAEVARAGRRGRRAG
jgi:DNA-binding MarR family transcriptional regulator